MFWKMDLRFPSLGINKEPAMAKRLLSMPALPQRLQRSGQDGEKEDIEGRLLRLLHHFLVEDGEVKRNRWKHW